MDISVEELIKTKINLFNENISDEEKENINNNINEEIEFIIKEFDKESDPIDE